MAKSLSYTSSRREESHEPIEFTIDDDDYAFTPPPTSGMTLDLIEEADNPMAQVRRMFDWLSEGLPEDENDRLVDRLRDDDDPLEWAVVDQLIQDLIEQVAGRPTSKPSASRRRR